MLQQHFNDVDAQCGAGFKLLYIQLVSLVQWFSGSEGRSTGQELRKKQSADIQICLSVLLKFYFILFL